MNFQNHIEQVYCFLQRKFPKVFQGSLGIRIFSIFLLYPFVFFALFMGGMVYNIFIFIFSLFLAYEWILVSDDTADEVSYLRYFSLISLSIFFAVIEHWIIAFLILLGGILFLGYGRYRKDLKVWHTIFGLFYIISACLALIWIRKKGLFPVTFLFAVVISSDTLAYSVGSWLKGPKICSSISPNKTWAGALAALFSAPVIALFVAMIFRVPITVLVLSGAIVLAIASVLGDLIESYLKRRFGVKDTSNIIPGHGGVWDRADALLLSSLVFTFLSFINWFPGTGIR